MKNKEIEELLNELKEVLDNPKYTDEMYNGKLIEFDKTYDLKQDEIKLILSYIERLEKENKTLGEIVIIKDEQLKEMQMQKTDYTAVNILEAKIEQLENNRDKAIELLNELSNLYDDNYTVSDKAKDIVNKLKGDSDVK